MYKLFIHFTEANRQRARSLISLVTLTRKEPRNEQSVTVLVTVFHNLELYKMTNIMYTPHINYQLICVSEKYIFHINNTC